MTKVMNLDDLCAIVVACAGGDSTQLEGAERTPFDDLGYDSLALIETAAQLKRDYGVVIPDEQILEVRTLEDLLEVINRELEAA